MATGGGPLISVHDDAGLWSVLEDDFLNLMPIRDLAWKNSNAAAAPGDSAGPASSYASSSGSTLRGSIRGEGIPSGAQAGDFHVLERGGVNGLALEASVTRIDYLRLRYAMHDAPRLRKLG